MRVLDGYGSRYGWGVLGCWDVLLWLCTWLGILSECACGCLLYE